MRPQRIEHTTPHSPLTAKDNKAVKVLASLADPKVRKKEKAFLIEGVKMVEEALRDKTGVRQVIACPSLTQHHGKGVIKLAEHSNVPLLWISDRLMDQLAESKTPQPAMALVEMRQYRGRATDSGRCRYCPRRSGCSALLAARAA